MTVQNLSPVQSEIWETARVMKRDENFSLTQTMYIERLKLTSFNSGKREETFQAEILKRSFSFWYETSVS